MTTIELRVRDLAAEEVDELLDTHDVEPAESFGTLAFDPLTGIVLIGGTLAAARLVLSIWERWQGGTVIDLTTTPATISRDRNKVPFGFFLILAADGEVRIEAKDEPKDALERLIEAVLQLGVGAKKTAVEALLGGKEPAAAAGSPR